MSSLTWGPRCEEAPRLFGRLSSEEAPQYFFLVIRGKHPVAQLLFYFPYLRLSDFPVALAKHFKAHHLHCLSPQRSLPLSTITTAIQG